MLTTPARNMQADEYIEAMFKALGELSTLTDQYRGLLSDAVNKSADFHELYAKVLLEEKAGEDMTIPVMENGKVHREPSGKKLTVDELKAKVTMRVSASERAADIAEALVKATREALELRKETIDACQSALAYSRAEMERTPNAEPIWRGVT